MRRLFVALLLTAGLAPAQPSNAAGGTVRADISWTTQTLGDGVVVIGVCTARATPGAGEVPVVTSAWCTVNGFQSPTVSVPGPFAAVVVGNATTAPVSVCAYALAVFSPTIGAPYSVTGETCRS